MADGLSGSLSQIPLGNLLRMLGAGAQTGRLRLVDGSDAGLIFVMQGDVVHAESAGASGEAAFWRLATWSAGNFRFEPGITAMDRTIDKSLDVLMAESARAASEREAMRRVIPSTAAVPRLARELSGASVTIEAADWAILSRMDGQASIAAIAADLLMDEGALVKQMVRLKNDGLFELEILPSAPQAPAPQRHLAGAPFFQALTAAVAEAMGPLAGVIVDDTVEAMGFTRASFPRQAVSTLCERIAVEIRDDAHRLRFQQTILSMLRSRAA